MDRPHRERLVVKLWLSQDKLYEEALRLEAIAQVNPLSANRTLSTRTTEKSNAEMTPAIDVAKIKSTKYDVQTNPPEEDASIRTHIPTPRKARTKRTPASFIRTRDRQNKRADAEFHEGLQENRVAEGVRHEGIRCKEEQFIKSDMAPRKTARKMEDCIQLHYHSPLGKGKKTTVSIEEELRGFLLARAARDNDPSPNTVGTKRQSPERRLSHVGQNSFGLG